MERSFKENGHDGSGSFTVWTVLGSALCDEAGIAGTENSGRRYWRVTNGYIGEETEEKMQAFWTVALFGVDSRNGELGTGTNSDTQMILSIDKESGEIKIASIYRDTFLMIQPEEGRCGKINSAYMMGGPQQQVVALNENLDLVIDDYISFSWKAAIDSVNMLGGIDLEITESEFQYLNSFITETAERSGVPSYHLKEAGLQHLDGVQTVAYCRLRLMDDEFSQD